MSVPLEETVAARYRPNALHPDDRLPAYVLNYHERALAREVSALLERYQPALYILGEGPQNLQWK